MHIFMTAVFTTCFLMTSLAQAADLGTRQSRKGPMQQQRGAVKQITITPEYLNKKILALTQQVHTLQNQVNSLRSVVHVNQNSTTIQAEYLTIKGKKHLKLVSSKKAQLTAGSDLALSSGKDLSLKGDKDLTAEGKGKIKLKGTQIKLNDGTKPLGLVGSHVVGGKVINGSVSVFAK